MMKKILFFLLSILIYIPALPQTPGYSALMINSHGKEWSADKSWDYVSGLVAKTILMFCNQYPEDNLSAQAFNWCKTYADNAIDDKGNYYNFKKGSLDNIASGKVLLELYSHELSVNSQNALRYQHAVEYLYKYLRYEYPRISFNEGKGGFIHKDSYPYQMWLDGLYMGAAFYAEYLATIAPDDFEGWSDIALQFTTIHKHTFDTEKSLNYHGWSAKPSDINSFWANENDPYIGCSKEFWGRGMGWYTAALVDVLDLMPQLHPDYEVLREIFSEVAYGIRSWQDSNSGVWFQLLQYDDSFVSAQGHANYLEASASCMFTYALFKGIRLGLLDSETFGTVALKAYEGLLSNFITEDGEGIDIHNICRSAGLGPFNKLERNGTADYYLDGSDVNIVSNEGKGIGSFIMASLEYEKYMAQINTSIHFMETNQSTLISIFDMQGRRCHIVPKGFYIEIRDGKATKKFNIR